MIASTDTNRKLEKPQKSNENDDLGEVSETDAV
jgi:hypothetical protein